MELLAEPLDGKGGMETLVVGNGGWMLPLPTVEDDTPVPEITELGVAPDISTVEPDPVPLGRIDDCTPVENGVLDALVVLLNSTGEMLETAGEVEIPVESGEIELALKPVPLGNAVESLVGTVTVEETTIDKLPVPLGIIVELPTGNGAEEAAIDELAVPIGNAVELVIRNGAEEDATI